MPRNDRADGYPRRRVCSVAQALDRKERTSTTRWDLRILRAFSFQVFKALSPALGPSPSAPANPRTPATPKPTPLPPPLTAGQ